MNVVRFSAVLARSRPAYNVSCTDGGDRTEGGREARLGSNGWVIISRAVQNVPDYGHHRKVGLP